MQLFPRLLAALAALLIVVPPLAARVPTLDDERGVMTMAPLLERATPAVVNVSVAATVSMENNPLFHDPFFRRFFNMPDQPPQRRAMAAGSGVIVDAGDGYILSNHHVVANADEITVTLADSDTIPQLSGARLSNIPESHPAHGRIQGVLVESVEEGSRAGLREGDIIVGVNRQRIDSLAQLQQVAQAMPRVAALNIVRGNTALFLVMP